MVVSKNWSQFVDAVQTMRDYQKSYYKTKDEGYLVNKQESEARVDFMLKSLEPEDDG